MSSPFAPPSTADIIRGARCSATMRYWCASAKPGRGSRRRADASARTLVSPRTLPIPPGRRSTYAFCVTAKHCRYLRSSVISKNKWSIRYANLLFVAWQAALKMGLVLKNSKQPDNPLRTHSSPALLRAGSPLLWSDIRVRWTGTLHQDTGQDQQRTDPGDRSRLFTGVPQRPGKSLRVDPSAGVGMTEWGCLHHETTTLITGLQRLDP